MKFEITEEEVDRIDEVCRQFDPAQHLAVAEVLEDLRFEDREVAVRYMRAELRAELYGGLIKRTALEAMAAHGCCESPDAPRQRVNADWEDRYHWDRQGRRGLRKGWGYHLGFVSDAWLRAVHGPKDMSSKMALMQALYDLLDLASVAMFGPIGHNFDELVPEDA